MRTVWLVLPLMMLTGCDSVVTASGTNGESSTGVSTSGPTTSPPDTITETSPTGIDPSSTTDNPLTTGIESSSGAYGSSSSSGGYGSSSGSTGWVGTTSGGESSSESSSSTDPTGIGFIDPSDSGPVANECDPYLQDCPAGQKCNAWSNDGGGNWNALGCFPIDPIMAQPGDACEVEGGGTSGIDTCELGSMCWDVDEENELGTCVAMCEGSAEMPTCSDPNTTCTIANEGVLNLCLPGCDPLIQDCPGGQACYGINDTFVCAPDASGEMGLAGDPCAFLNACDAGNACLAPDAVGPACPAGSPACCSEFCSLTTPSCSLAGQECIPWFDEGAAPPQYTDVGICSVPA